LECTLQPPLLPANAGKRAYLFSGEFHQSRAIVQ
jgi:hypothetical protein